MTKKELWETYKSRFSPRISIDKINDAYKKCCECGKDITKEYFIGIGGIYIEVHICKECWLKGVDNDNK